MLVDNISQTDINLHVAKLAKLESAGATASAGGTALPRYVIMTNRNMKAARAPLARGARSSYFRTIDHGTIVCQI